MTSYLSRLSEVSKSGYYRWLHAEQTRQIKEVSDEQDLILIKNQFNAFNKKAGTLVIKMFNGDTWRISLKKRRTDLLAIR
ncbi:hypothetical protein Back11_39370 [Paenibacillus baekrokdamisoli]|uniref:Uncharacterized protein n=1 Tax=Paenibacillus baekrokdamisoli TaxID=1712516 RepID=A0A3G9IWC2_9BACL|nr:hypothetical protein [Paenibacillus baekrokdamisoli]MBB3068363.1 hypothetical protein [Paenibacillus baekrokdamisoli]BBH22592.1 hypothetical protein Back11_39370 [Paenibacillus baekrokdamisoli]